jgi:hypothetical protein
MSMMRTPAPRPPGSVHANRASMPTGDASRYSWREVKSGVTGGASSSLGAMSLRVSSSTAGCGGGAT